MVAAAAAMSCTLAHSRTEWYSWPPGEEVRRRQALRREDGAVGAAARDREPRLDAGAPDRLERGVDDPRVLLDVRPHVAVRVAHLDLHVRAGLAHLDLTGELAQELHVLREELVVVIAGDEVDDGLLRVARDAARVDVALPRLGRLRRQRSPREARGRARRRASRRSRAFPSPCPDAPRARGS